MSIIGVTGATGQIGSRVAQSLADAGRPAVLLPRRPEAAAGLPAAEVRACDYAHPGDSLRGIDVLLMVSAREARDRDEVQRAFVDAAGRAGVQSVVYTSFAAPSPTATFSFARTHYDTEQHLRASGLSWTFLRDNFYLDVLPEFADEEGVIRGPAADGRVAAVARADVADVASRCLLDHAEFRDTALNLTGPEALSLDDIARIVSEVTGRRLSYQAESLEEAVASRAGYGADDWQLEGWISTYTAIAAGELDEVSQDVERVLGRAPLSLADVVRAQAARH